MVKKFESINMVELAVKAEKKAMEKIIELEKCEICKEKEDRSYDKMCFECWEELMEHLEEEI